MQEVYVLTVDDIEYGNISTNVFTSRSKALDCVEWFRHDHLKNCPRFFRGNSHYNVVYSITKRSLDIIGFDSTDTKENIQGQILCDKNWKPFIEWQKSNARDPLQIQLDIDELKEKHDYEVKEKGYNHFECSEIRRKIDELKEDLEESIEIHKTIKN